MLTVIQFILSTESSVYRKNLKFCIKLSISLNSSFLENPRNVENSIASLSVKMKDLQAEFSKSEQITSAGNINRTSNRNSADVIIGELIALERDLLISDEINRNLSQLSRSESKKKSRPATPRKKRKTCHDVQNMLQRTFHREVGTILKSNTTLSTTRALEETSGPTKRSLAGNEESSNEIFNPFE